MSREGLSREAPGLNFVQDDALSGFRLKRLELLNWGTFDGRIWTLKADGKNTLLTGDIGSGKSTLVDAVTTLLVPARNIAYNKAAGADIRERSLRSYVLGYYKSERSEAGGSSKPVALRDHNNYSVILGVFYNEGYQETVTLAQVYWMKEAQGQPARFYAASDTDMTIAADFSGFGADISNLRKKLRGRTEVFDSFPSYGAWFRRRFGIENEQALELFHQTVSMKSVGNLTDFVRRHMLEPFDVEPRIAALIGHFDDLNRAHEAVLKAKRQVEMLTPLVEDCDRQDETARGIELLRKSRDALKPYFASLKRDLLDRRIARLSEEWAELDTQVAKYTGIRDEQRAEESALRRSKAENGGDRMEQLDLDIRRKEAEKQAREKKNRRYAELAEAVGEKGAEDEAGFLIQKKRFLDLAETGREKEARVQNEITELGVNIREKRSVYEKLEAEITSLKTRKSSIPSEQIALRGRMCGELGLSETDMPFAGELLQVREEEREWEGAAERILRNFGRSLLVPDAHYSRVAEWVDRTHLQGHLVYFRVRGGSRQDIPLPGPDSLVRKIAIKPDSLFYDWLEKELTSRFDFVCCVGMEQFRRETRAVTRAGQVKAPGERHEKDDRHRLNDRGRYILGWTNTGKLAALEEERKAFETVITEMGQEFSAAQNTQRALQESLAVFSKLAEYVDYSEIDWRTPALEIARLQEEKRALENSSDIMKQLSERLDKLLKEAARTKDKLNELRDHRSKTEQKKSDAESQKKAVIALLEEAGGQLPADEMERLSGMRAEMTDGQPPLSVENADSREREMREGLQGRIDSEEHKNKRQRDRIIQAMSAYRSAFRLDTGEVDAAIDAADEYRGMLRALKGDDLPRFEARFKELLNENTIREVANFHSQLARERETIRERIDRINMSLTRIDYNPGRYIVLEAQPTTDADIRDFQTELRACTEGTLTGSEDYLYSESKFIEVKRIIERFRGGEGKTDLDQNWTRKVTDVRNWFHFSASERYREDDKEYEHYSDSGGKSGGQKEKLAYTILAASLAYQFGLEWGSVKSRSFRFVVIDEAFGRGSDESAQYGLRLFEQLKLQLLIVTPLQKIHVIEPFVRCVGFVQNPEGRDSRLRNLTIEEYREEKEKMIR